MLIIALVMAVIGLAALVTAVVTSNEVIAWVGILASVVGVVLLIIDALRERQRRDAGQDTTAEAQEESEAPTETFEFPPDLADEEPPEASSEADSGDSGRRSG